MRIKRAEIEMIQEPIRSAFGFKGKYTAKPMWNTAVLLTGETGEQAIGLSNQGILWSDAAVYDHFSPVGGNALMYLMADYACRHAEHQEFGRPDELLRQLLPDVRAYGERIAGFHLRETFALNALVALDTAAWLLYARENGITGFDQLVPGHAAPYLAEQHRKIAAIPLITYSATAGDVMSEVAKGSFFLKIKIGSDPERDGDLEKMLAWDRQRLTEIHSALQDLPCPYSDCGHIPYYLDANGRYDSMDRLNRLLEHADHIGMLDRIVLLEEPFPEALEADVSHLPVRVAADESAHSDADVRSRIDMGYGAIALKPIAKTMSMTFDMIRVCGERGIPCFCADLTVNAQMVDLNKNFAARLKAIPGINVGLLESNGHQYYARWNEMCSALPEPKAAWVHPLDGLYHLDEAFYARSGGIFEMNSMYRSLF